MLGEICQDYTKAIHLSPSEKHLHPGGCNAQINYTNMNNLLFKK
jgi:hypothetical protein